MPYTDFPGGSTDVVERHVSFVSLNYLYSIFRFSRPRNGGLSSRPLTMSCRAQGQRSDGGTLPWLARPLGTASPSTCGLHHCPEIHLRKNSKLSYLAASALEVFSNWALYKLTYSFIHSPYSSPMRRLVGWNNVMAMGHACVMGHERWPISISAEEDREKMEILTSCKRRYQLRSLRR